MCQKDHIMTLFTTTRPFASLVAALFCTALLVSASAPAVLVA